MRLITFTLAAFVLAAPVYADTEGVPGELAGMRLFNQQSSEFSRFHGGVSVDEGHGMITEYFWGGNTCPGIDALDNVVAHTSRALGNDKLRIKPLYKPGAGGTLCLTGVTIVQKKYLDTIAAIP